ncbi:MAG: response regulator [candidate division Zixibacteria bacterium]|nr:response regulator [candidate division Zixibacteria bacterium]
MTHVEVLLVEDNPYDAELTIRALKQHNLANHLHHVTDGVEALEFLTGSGRYSGRAPVVVPRVVLLDLKLPKLDGAEVLRRMRADDRLKHIPVVILTSSREEQDLVKTYALGANSYVVKPVEFGDFTSAVAELGMYWLLLNQPPATPSRGATAQPAMARAGSGAF